MLKLIKSQIHLSDKWLLRARTSFPWSRIVKDPKETIKALDKIVLVVAGKRATTWFLGLVAFARRINQIRVNQGKEGLARYLKTSKLMLMQAVAMPSRKLSGQSIGKHAVAKTRTGLPRLIPSVHRKSIRKGDTVVIQFWLTLFSLYKVFELKPIYKISTITNSGVPESVLEASGVLSQGSYFRELLFNRGFHTLAKGTGKVELRKAEYPDWYFTPLPILMKVTPNTLKGEIAFFNLIRDAKVWVNHPLLPLLRTFCKTIEDCYPKNSNVPGRKDGSYMRAFSMLEELGKGDLLSLGGKRVQAYLLDKLVARDKEIHALENSRTPLNLQQRLKLALSKMERFDDDWTFGSFTESLETEDIHLDVFGMYSGRTAESQVARATKDSSPLPVIGSLGRLGLKSEPSGKVRVFAMVDWWTQSFMSPIHKWLFRILRTIREDATFDQDSAVTRFSKLIKSRKLKYIYSFDLSAATDRLPLLIQIKLLGSMLTDEVATLWGALLVGRGFKVPKKVWPFLPKGTLGSQLPRLFHSSVWWRGLPWFAHTGDIMRFFLHREVMHKYIYYKVGAPMGCLSNWAMLALTHHYLVQLAAKAAGHSQWFDEYLILGDDVVIGNHEVAIEYQHLMLDIGVPINRSKTLVSDNGSFEFAAQFVLKGETNCSPFSFDEINVAKTSLPGLVLLFSKLRRQSNVSLKSILQFLGFGHRTVSQVNRSFHYLIKTRQMRLLQALALLRMPGVSPWSASSYSQWLLSTSIVGPPTSRRIEPAEEILHEKEIAPFAADLPNEDFILWDKVFIKTPTSEQEKAQFQELIQPLLDKWEDTRSEAVEKLFHIMYGKDRPGFDTAMTTYLEQSAKLAMVPKRLRWESLQETSFRPNVGRWLRLWLRLWTSLHHPNWSPRNQSIKLSRQKALSKAKSIKRLSPRLSTR